MGALLSAARAVPDNVNRVINTAASKVLKGFEYKNFMQSSLCWQLSPAYGSTHVCWNTPLAISVRFHVFAFLKEQAPLIMGQITSESEALSQAPLFRRILPNDLVTAGKLVSN